MNLQYYCSCWSLNHIVLIPTADSDNDSEMWNMFLDEAKRQKKEDNRFTDVWSDDANSIPSYVRKSFSTGFPVFISVSGCKIGLPFLRNC